MSARRALRMIALLIMAVTLFGALNTSAYAREKSYYEISDNTSDDKYNIILLGGGGDNKVFRDGKDYGKVTADNIISALDENKINVLSGHSTGANQVELFIRSGELEDYIDVYVIVDGQAYVGEDRYCNGDTPHPVLIFMSDQMNRYNIYCMENQYSNYKVFEMRELKHVNIATDHFHEVVDLIREYCEAYGIEHGKLPEEAHKLSVEIQRTVDLTAEVLWSGEDAEDAARPDSVTVSLYAGDELISEEQVVPDEDGKWLCTFKKLPRYVDDRKVEYRVEQTAEGFETTVTPTETGFLIENRRTTVLDGMVIWMDGSDRAGKRPQTLTVYLTDGVNIAAQKKVTASDGWRYSFEALPMYSAGRKISYGVEADNIPGYSRMITGTSVLNTRILGR